MADPKLTPYRKRLLLVQQLAFTEAIMLCAGVSESAARYAPGARLCADLLTQHRDRISEKSGLRKAMGWSRARRTW